MGLAVPGWPRVTLAGQDGVTQPRSTNREWRAIRPHPTPQTLRSRLINRSVPPKPGYR